MQPDHTGGRPMAAATGGRFRLARSRVGALEIDWTTSRPYRTTKMNVIDRRQTVAPPPEETTIVAR